MDRIFFGDQIDVVVSNNDGMGMSMFNAWAKDNKVPTFGYDANSDAVAAIAEGYGGTISQHADVQAYLTLRVLRNALDGVDIDTGIGTPDDAGNCLTEGEDYRYSEEERSYYALNIAVTADNYQRISQTQPRFIAKYPTSWTRARVQARRYGLIFTMLPITSLAQLISHFFRTMTNF